MATTRSDGGGGKKSTTVPRNTGTAHKKPSGKTTPKPSGPTRTVEMKAPSGAHPNQNRAHAGKAGMKRTRVYSQKGGEAATSRVVQRSIAPLERIVAEPYASIRTTTPKKRKLKAPGAGK